MLADEVKRPAPKSRVVLLLATDAQRDSWRRLRGAAINAIRQCVTKQRLCHGGGAKRVKEALFPRDGSAVGGSHFVEPGSRMLAFKPWDKDSGTQAIVFRRPDGKRVVVCGNTRDGAQPLTIQLGNRFLNVNLAPHSFNTFVEK